AGVGGARGPGVLAVGDEMVAVAGRAGAQAGQVRSGAGFADSEGGGHFPAQDRYGPARLLFGSAEGDEGGGDDALSLRVAAFVDLAASEFLPVHVLLQNRGIAATEFGWVSGNQPAVVELGALPGA